MFEQPQASHHADLSGSDGQTTHRHHLLQRVLKLSPRQAEISLWITQGKTNAAIADLLTISRRTVDKHVQHILEKVQVPNRTALTYCVQQHVLREESLRDLGNPRGRP